jgi:hypothetical protein
MLMNTLKFIIVAKRSETWVTKLAPTNELG